MGTRWWCRVLLGAVTVGLFVLPGVGPGRTPATAAAGSDPVRVMLFGDSITQGSTGDWTWRYRLWQTLAGEGASVDFVGPRQDLVTFASTTFGNLRYKDPGFDLDHAALWGKRFTGPGFRLKGVAEAYRPDVVVGLIGINDLKDGVTPRELERRWRREIARTREVLPRVSFLLVRLPHVWVDGVRAYNRRLAVVAADLDRPGQRVRVTARVRFGMSDLYDWVHPSATGERKLAAVVADGLAALGIGQGARGLPDPVPTGAWAPVPTASVAGTRITVGWSPVGYASSENIHVDDLTTGTTQVAELVEGTSYAMDGEPGHTYRFRLFPVKGYLPTGPVSTSAEVTVEPSA